MCVVNRATPNSPFPGRSVVSVLETRQVSHTRVPGAWRECHWVGMKIYREDVTFLYEGLETSFM